MFLLVAKIDFNCLCGFINTVIVACRLRREREEGNRREREEGNQREVTEYEARKQTHTEGLIKHSIVSH